MKLEKGDYPALEAHLNNMLGISDSPIGFYYTDTEPLGAVYPKKKGRVCIYPFLNQARRGKTVYFSKEWRVCRGGAFYLGYKKALMKGIGCFLSNGIPGRLEGERFKKTPELGDETVGCFKYVPAGGDYIVFKPVSKFTPDEPLEAIIIFGNADVMGAMVVMANYARPGTNAVIVQFSSGCYSIVTEPRIQAKEGDPRAVLGSFDVACRPYLDPNTMTFTAPGDMMWDMAMDMEESFLGLNPWKGMRGRGVDGNV